MTPDDASLLGAPPPEEFLDTQAVLHGVRRGDGAAASALWARFRPGVETLIWRQAFRQADPRLRNRLLAESDDLVNQTLVRAHQGLNRFEYRGPGSFMAWLAQIALNEVRHRIEYWQAERRRVSRENPEPAPATHGDLPLPSGEPGPPTQAIRSERRRRVAAALASLEERPATILLLRFFAGADWEEIAREVGAPSADAVRMECNGKALPALAAALSRV